MSYKTAPLTENSTYKLLIDQNQKISFLAGSTFPLGFKADSACTINGDLNVGYKSTNVIQCTGDVIAYSTSDRKLKDNIQLISDPINKIMMLSGNSFTWNGKAPEHCNGKTDIGVIAQEIEKVIPEAVREVDGVKSVRYEKIIPLLIECIKTQQTQIDKLILKQGV
tara:strand:- start:4424 stop:4921 length:498 start_codon:yes stop_codon:yes gene_type:complete